MRSCLICFVLLIVSCNKKPASQPFNKVEVHPVFEDSLSIRAIELMPGSLAFAANKGVFGSIALQSGKLRSNVQRFDTILPEFRAVAKTTTDFFMLSVADPALLYKTGDDGVMKLVYTERDSLVFYDAMKFWNDKEGLAIGDSMDGCLSVIITRDGGTNWSKISCEDLPASDAGEGAFAASNTNIAIVGDHCWIATTSSKIYYSPDKGRSWMVYQTPIINKAPTQGIYSLDFYDEHFGIAVGGDYTQPEAKARNAAITKDGGKSWELIADGLEPDYKSCVQFVPGTKGNGIVALGFTGISYSADAGNHWNEISSESFYTLRFLNDTVAYAAGRGRIAKLVFK